MLRVNPNPLVHLLLIRKVLLSVLFILGIPGILVASSLQANVPVYRKKSLLKENKNSMTIVWTNPSPIRITLWGIMRIFRHVFSNWWFERGMWCKMAAESYMYACNILYVLLLCYLCVAALSESYGGWVKTQAHMTCQYFSPRNSLDAKNNCNKKVKLIKKIIKLITYACGYRNILGNSKTSYRCLSRSVGLLIPFSHRTPSLPTANRSPRDVKATIWKLIYQFSF